MTMNKRTFLQTLAGGVGCTVVKPKKVLKRIASTEYLGARPCATEILGWSKMQRRSGYIVGQDAVEAMRLQRDQHIKMLADAERMWDCG